MAEHEILELEDKRRLELTLRTRETIINGLMKNGIPEATSDRVTLMQALDGMDRTVLSKTKIKADDKANQNQQQTVKMIADILSRYNAKSTSAERSEAPEVPEGTIELKAVDGEKGSLDSNLNYENFMVPAI